RAVDGVDGEIGDSAQEQVARDAEETAHRVATNGAPIETYRDTLCDDDHQGRDPDEQRNASAHSDESPEWTPGQREDDEERPVGDDPDTLGNGGRHEPLGPAKQVEERLHRPAERGDGAERDDADLRVVVQA